MQIIMTLIWEKSRMKFIDITMTVTVSSLISVSGNLVHFNATWWKLLVLICFWQFQQISLGLNIAQHVCYDRWGRGLIGGQKSRGCRLQVCALCWKLMWPLNTIFSNKNLHNYPVVIKCTLTKVDIIFVVKTFQILILPSSIVRMRGWRPVTSWRPPWRTPAGARPRSPPRSRCPTTSHLGQPGR